jgi:NAD(P)-dependent dehydrogenase (short-subunit alcohol dehydrogenase family)
VEERPHARRALVTGAVGGIGLATARRLLRDGAAVALVDVDAVALERAAAALGERALALVADVADEDAIAAATGAAVRAFGGLDAIVANAPSSTPATTAPTGWTPTSGAPRWRRTSPGRS